MENLAISRSQIGGESPIVAAESFEGCIYTGFFGTIDSARMEAITNKLALMVESTENKYVIIDLSNVEAIDTAVAIQLVRVADTMLLLGSRPIFCGLKGVIARIMVGAGVDLGRHTIVKSLKEANRKCIEWSGYELVKK